MTPHQTLTVAVRLFAIWLAFYVTREVIGVHLAGRERADPFIAPGSTIIFIGTVIVVLVLWFFPRSVARRLLPGTNDSSAEAAPPDIWFAIGTSLIGLWLVATAVPGVLRNLFVMYLMRSEAIDRSGLIVALLYLLAQIAVGGFLIFGASGAKRFFHWARYGGEE